MSTVDTIDSMASGAATGRLQGPEVMESKPWYRHGWLWFLLSFPLVSVVLGVMMLFLSLQTNNSLVVDDYYKQGKAINVRIERDKNASLLGLRTRLQPTIDGLIIQVEQSVPDGLPDELRVEAMALSNEYVHPENVSIRWVHITQDHLDGEAQARHAGGGRYVLPDLTLPAEGKYRLHIQPEGSTGSGNWRLVGPLQSFNITQAFELMALEPAQVFPTTRQY